MATRYFADVAVLRTLDETIGAAGSDSAAAGSGGGTATVMYDAATDDPGSNGSGSAYTVKVNVTGSANGLTMAARIGAVTVAQGAYTSEQDISAGGVFTFSPTFSHTWIASQRLELTIRVTNSNAHGGSKTATWAVGDANTYVDAPWTAAQVSHGTSTLTATAAAASTGHKDGSGASDAASVAVVSSSATKTASGTSVVAVTGSFSSTGSQVSQVVHGSSSITASATMLGAGRKLAAISSLVSATSSEASSGSKVASTDSAVSTLSGLAHAATKRAIGTSTLSSAGSFQGWHASTKTRRSLMVAPAIAAAIAPSLCH